MSIKAQLVELLTDDNCPIIYMQGNVGGLADYLIKRGVTIQKWIPVTEREPRASLEVLVCLPSGDCVVAVKFGSFWYKGWSGSRLTKDPTHWIPLPATPKEGANCE